MRNLASHWSQKKLTPCELPGSKRGGPARTIPLGPYSGGSAAGWAGLSPALTGPHLHVLPPQRPATAVVDVHRACVVAFQRRPDHHIIQSVQVEVIHGRDRRSEPGPAWLVFVLFRARIVLQGRTARLFNGFQAHLIFKPCLAER